MLKSHLKNLNVAFYQWRRKVQKRDSETNVNEAADTNTIANIVWKDIGNLQVYFAFREEKINKNSISLKNIMPDLILFHSVLQ